MVHEAQLASLSPEASYVPFLASVGNISGNGDQTPAEK